MIKHILPSKDINGKSSMQSLYTTPVVLLANAPKQNNVWNRLLVNISDEVGELGAVVAVFVVVGNEAWHGWVVDNYGR
jgi:hypothetical protein